EPGGGDDARLVGYVVVRPGADPPSVSELRSFVRERLPEAMVPTAFVPLPALPRNANGKIDRGALPAPDAARPELAREFAAPRNPIEEKLAEIWSQLLRVERVGIHDSFFDLGGHSLLATQALARVRDALGVEVSLRSLFGEPTIARLAAVIEQAAPRLALAPPPTPTPPAPGGVSAPAAPAAADSAPAAAVAAKPAGPTRIQRVQRGRKPGDLLAQLDGLSDEEVRKLLQQKRGAPRDPGAS
ncbi:MAG TPA: phosphopantetheine-binding protein, partial [Thermoanaerobaculia bacterium]|nr:phosphopantetheine-binding protein [Thermoanaerobaculia bacterium]